MSDSAELVTGRQAARRRRPLPTPVPFEDDALPSLEPSRAVLPAVGLISIAGHGLLLAIAVLIPRPDPIDAVIEPLAVEVVEPAPPPPVIEPEPEPEPEPVPVQPAAIVDRPRPRHVRREEPPPAPEAEPAPPASVLAAQEAGTGTWSHEGGEREGRLGGQPGGTGTAVPGTVGDPELAPQPGISRAMLRRMLIAYIRDTLSRFLDGRIDYPIAARRDRMQGVVMLRVRLARDGRILAVRLSQTSGHDMLDQAALASVQGLGSMPAPPREIPWDDARELPLPVTYELR